MARTIRTKVYKFSELSEPAKQKAIEWYRGSSYEDGEFAWEDTKDDAENIGLKIISLDDHRTNVGEFLLSANEVAQNIFNNHGEDCDTYKTARKFMDEWEPLFAKYWETEEGEDKLMELETEFLHDLLEDYRIIFNKNYEYIDSDEYIIETIIANDYEFTQDGRRF